MPDTDAIMDTTCRQAETLPVDAVWRLLARAVGEQHALTLQAMADQIGCGRRDVERAIELSLPQSPFLVVAGAKGYFRPTMADQINAYVSSLHTRHRRMQLREAAVKRKARAEGWAEESGLFVAPPEATQAELFV